MSSTSTVLGTEWWQELQEADWQELDWQEVDVISLDEPIDTSQKEPRLLWKSDQSTKFKKSDRVRTTAIDCGSGDFLKAVEELTGIHSAGGGGEKIKGVGHSGESEGNPGGPGLWQPAFLPNHLKLPRRPAPLQIKYFPEGFRRLLQPQKPFRYRKRIPERRVVRLRLSSCQDQPPDDGYSWRKYGQKDSLEAMYPRSYYRCTYRKVQGCWATKQVQRSDDEPTVFEITYRGSHTCDTRPGAVVLPLPPENQTDYDTNSSIDDAPLQIIQARNQQQNQTQGGPCVITTNLDSNNDNHNLSCSMFDVPLTSDDMFGFKIKNSNFYSSPHFLSPSTIGTNCLSVSPARDPGTPESVLPLAVSATTSGNNSQATRREEESADTFAAYQGNRSDDDKMQPLVEEKSTSDQAVTTSVGSCISRDSGLRSRAAEYQKEPKKLLGIDLLQTKSDAERMPELRIVGLSEPPEDGYTWRKYGQKEIRGAKYTREYYGCHYAELYSCPAKKKVERTLDDPTVFKIMYHNNHTCHSSAVFPPPPLSENQTESGSDALSPSTIGTNCLSVSPWLAGFSDSFQVGPSSGTPESKLPMVVSATTSGNNSQAMEKSTSDQALATSVGSCISRDLGLRSRAAEYQKEPKKLLGIDLLQTKADYVTNEGSLLSDLKEERNVAVSSRAIKLEATQKQRAESHCVPMQSTRGTETELFPWLVDKDADPHAAPESADCSESENEGTDKKMKIEATLECHKIETSESEIFQMQNTVNVEVANFSVEENKDAASEEIHSYSLEQGSEFHSYLSGLEYGVGDKKVKIEASPEYDIMHVLEMQKESSLDATLNDADADASIDMLGGSGKQEGRPSEGWGAANYESIVDHLVKYIKESNVGKIGIYGRNEVGKACAVERLKKSAILSDHFDRVICVTVPLHCDMQKVQDEIAGKILSDLTKANEVDMPHSVMDALGGLKFLLIVDGINQQMKLETLRIPDSTPSVGSKIVFVAGSDQLCDEIEVDEKICVDDLLLCELFRQIVGEAVYHPKKDLAWEIVRMCRKYSHAVILVARALQNVDDVLIWKHALERLTLRPASHEAVIEALTVNVLKFSIDQLEDDKTRSCLKNLALCNNYHEIASEFAIGLWVRDGIVETPDEGQKVLQNLVNADLLKVDENGKSVKFQDQDQDILVNLIFQSEENRMFLMRGGLDLKEPPVVEEWESAKEICLINTGISELPKEPRCHSLSSLFLQRNYKLRNLSSSFFNRMPALEVLNLSRTRIRCLPESISQLVSLKRLFLNDCVLLRSISPAIGRLKQLQLFDLEGTKITNLPKEIECLINLTCLGISVTGTEASNDSKTWIPRGVISSLLYLEELNLDVDADAEWWDKSAEGIVSEVCNLERLSALKFSFPTLEHLRQFNQLRKSMGHPSLDQFRLLVGKHANRIMTRLPSDIEFELEQCNRYLRYTNGDGISTDIRDILQQSDAFFLERHANLKKLSELGIGSMDQLKWCVLGECNELEVLMDASDAMHQEASTESHCKSICLESLEFLYVYYMRNLTSIWKGPVEKGCLSSLKLLTLRKCPELTVIFPGKMIDNLNNLEEVIIEDCPAIKSLICCQTSTGKVHETSYFLPKLKKLSLHHVPELSSISCGLRIAPRLERLSFYDCPSLKSLSTDEVSSEHLKKIRGERSWWKDLEWRRHKPDRFDGIFVPIDECDIP